MYVVFGSRLFGTCDVVPELFHVKTMFFHVDYIPLFPTGSYLVFGDGKDAAGIKIPFSFKSWILTWARAAMFIWMVVAGIWTIVNMNDPRESVAIPLLSFLVAGSFFAFFMIYPRKKMPSYARACRLAEHAGLTEEGWAALNVMYGRDPMDRPGQASPTDVLAAR